MSGHRHSAAKAEIVTGLLSNSLALLADSAHVFTDITAIVLALGATELAARPATARRSYGYLRLEIVAAVVNAQLLFGVAAVVLIEAVRRIGQEPLIQTGPMLFVSSLAFVANLCAAQLLRGAGPREPQRERRLSRGSVRCARLGRGDRSARPR